MVIEQQKDITDLLNSRERKDQVLTCDRREAGVCAPEVPELLCPWLTPPTRREGSAKCKKPRAPGALEHLRAWGTLYH